MASFADLLRGVNSRIGFNADDPDRADNDVDLKLGFSAKPKAHINLDMEKKTERAIGSDDSTSQVEKTSSKLKINHGDCTTTYTFANDKMAFDAKGKAVDDASWRVDIGMAAEAKQAESKWKVTGNLDVKGKDLGGAKLSMNGSAEYNEKGAIKVKPAINLEVADEFNVGVSLQSDTKAVQEIRPQLVYKPKDCKNSFYWARADLTRSWLMLGCDQKLKDTISHSFELLYGYGKDFKGLQGQPVVIRGGVNYELSDQTEVGAAASFGETYSVGMDVEHKVDKHWTVSASQSFDSERVGKPYGPYHIGFAASYKL